ncbi:hypothetical protein PO856_001168 [Pectobacterium brasiliense]|uniref:hypothetical protein n=1 Tax=Pectobacterium brasiliense TaxID=180957 RepID=UPI0024063056|nr:hypothetical protein [Pectobacterium brasiliense]MDG0804143.1 hypothetical protein [Pectobacterium brasiliense]
MEKIKKYSLHLLMVIVIILFLALIYIINNNSIFVIESSFTDSVQAMSGVLSFVGGMLAVIVSIYISRKDTREKKEELDLKRRTVVSYLYYTICELDQVFNDFERNFYPLIFKGEVYISDSIYNYHFNQLVQASEKLKEYQVSDMPHYKILIMFVTVKENIEKTISFANKFKQVHNEKMVFNSVFSVVQPHYQSDFRAMIIAMDTVRLETKKMSGYLGVKYP